jgi:hypothetical protein
MSFEVRRVEYFYTTVRDEPGQGYELLATLGRLGVNLLAFNAVPIGPERVQLALFPDDPRKLETEARKAGLHLEGPHPALVVQGDDELGALAGIHAKLRQSGVSVYASAGVTDGRGGFGYVMYLRPETVAAALEALRP